MCLLRLSANMLVFLRRHAPPPLFFFLPSSGERRGGGGRNHFANGAGLVPQRQRYFHQVIFPPPSCVAGVLLNQNFECDTITSSAGPKISTEKEEHRLGKKRKQACSAHARTRQPCVNLAVTVGDGYACVVYLALLENTEPCRSCCSYVHR